MQYNRIIRRMLLFWGLVGVVLMSHAQNWASIGKFNRGPTCVWYDSLAEKLYVAGSYCYFDSTEVHGFGYLQGDTLIPLGCGFEACGLTLPYLNGGTPEVKDFERYLGTLYVTGFFRKAGGSIVNGIAKWVGNDWVAVGTGLSYTGDPGSGIGMGMEVMGNELYLYGVFDSIDGVEANGLAKFDGKHWSAVHNFPHFNTSPSNPNRIVDAEWYHGELYVGGAFQKAGSNPSIWGITKWNGTDWVAVDVGLTGLNPAVSSLLIYDDKLIIGGHFNPYVNAGSFPGDNVTSWDGNAWDTLRGGVSLHTTSGSVDGAFVYRDELYVFGNFDKAGDVPTKNIAKWNGESWCGMGLDNDFFLRSMAIVNDTIFVAFPSGTVGSQDSIAQFAKWIGPAPFSDCQAVAVEEPTAVALQVSLFPNPAQSHFTLTLPQGSAVADLQIHDVAGRLVVPTQRYRAGEQVDVAALPAGLYFVEVQLRGRVEVLKMIICD